jgi:competence protein ComEC
MIQEQDVSGRSLSGMRWVGFFLAWLLGTALALHQPELCSATVYGGLAWLALLLWVVATRTGPLVGLLLGAGLAPVLLGFALTGMHGNWRVGQWLPTQLDGVNIDVVGVVAELPKVAAGGVRFVLAVESAQREGQAVQLPSRISLGWYRYQSAGDALDNSPLASPGPVKAGQRWKFKVRLKRPHGLVNPDGFDYELYLLERGLGATGYVRDQGAELVDGSAGFSVQSLRQRVKDAIVQHVPNPRVAGVISGLAIGDQSAIEREDWDLFRTTGIAHLVSISGLHVTMFAWMAGGVVYALWRRSTRAVLWWPARSAARWVGLLAAASYALFAGWGVPAQRTVWMLATVVLLQALGRRWPWPMVLLAAAVVVTGQDPWALLQPGFWLSFAAVGLLLASNSGSPQVAQAQKVP